LPVGIKEPYGVEDLDGLVPLPFTSGAIFTYVWSLIMGFVQVPSTGPAQGGQAMCYRGECWAAPAQLCQALACGLEPPCGLGSHAA
jgi:hypothetical protein